MRNERGVSLIEVAVMMTILAVTALAFTQSMVVTSRSSRQSDEYLAAARAARSRLESVAAQNFFQIATLNAAPNNTFRVPLTEASAGLPQIDLPGLPAAPIVAPAVVPHAGEVVVITAENVTALSPLLRDLSPQDGTGDRVRFVQLPMDMNGDGDTSDGVLTGTYPSAPVRLLVGVVIRWMGATGEERYEAWTVVNRETVF